MILKSIFLVLVHFNSSVVWIFVIGWNHSSSSSSSCYFIWPRVSSASCYTTCVSILLCCVVSVAVCFMYWIVHLSVWICVCVIFHAIAQFHSFTIWICQKFCNLPKTTQFTTIHSNTKLNVIVNFVCLFFFLPFSTLERLNHET